MTFSMTRAPQIQDQILLILLQVSRTLGEFRIVIGGLFHNLNSPSCVASSSSFFLFFLRNHTYILSKGNMVQIRVQLRRIRKEPQLQYQYEQDHTKEERTKVDEVHVLSIFILFDPPRTQTPAGSPLAPRKHHRRPAAL